MRSFLSIKSTNFIIYALLFSLFLIYNYHLFTFLFFLFQYMKALKSTIGTSQPLLSLEDFNTIFYRIPELHSLHTTFLKGLRKQIDNWDSIHPIGEDFKILVGLITFLSKSSKLKKKLSWNYFNMVYCF